MTKIPINIKSGSIEEKKTETIIGIDLGTTNSLVAMVDAQTRKPFCLSSEDKDTIVPSVIYIDENKKTTTGKEAKKHLNISPERTIYSAKRLMGKSYQDFEKNGQKLSYPIYDNGKNDLVRIQIDESFYTPIELSSFILAELKNRAEIHTKQKISKAVITVPAYFNDVQRQATRDAGKLAGLEVLRVLNEPTAAALAYGFGLDKNTQKTIAVYDLGGGTFDISILQLQNGIYEVLSTHGNTMLGGDDFDNSITNFWIENNPKLIIVPALRTTAEEARKYLSVHEEFNKEIETEGEKTQLKLDKNKLEELIKPLIVRTIQSCKNAVKDAEIPIDDIEEVILVGGTTRTPLVKNAVANFFSKSHINDNLNPDEIVALGAAVEADILAGNNKDMLLLDVTPLSLGIETLGGLMDVMITRNSKIPCSIAKEYTTSVDGQINLSINVYQGERELVGDNRKLGEFVLKNIPAMPAGLPKIKVTFHINADGILTILAEETRSGTKQEIELKPQFGLTDAEMEKMLLASIQNAEKDMQARLLLEAQNEGRQLIYVTERFIEKNQNLINQEERAQTIVLLNELKSSLELNDKNIILNKIETLNEFTRPFAERLMDTAISKALKGKKLS